MDREKSLAYRCWLQYRPLKDSIVREAYRAMCSQITIVGEHQVMETALFELKAGIKALLGIDPDVIKVETKACGIALGCAYDTSAISEAQWEQIDEEGYIFHPSGKGLIIAGKTERGILYGVFAFLRCVQSGAKPDQLPRVENPVNQLRMINHWDNIDGSIERGYAGKSLFFKDNQIIEDKSRLQDYARLMASIGINGVVLNNVNVHTLESKLISELLPEVAGIAETLRRYGIATYLSINYSSSIELGGLSSADPLDASVQEWWCQKAKEVYSIIPDLGGFLVKADSEFRPGPFTYGRNHADGANMLGRALKPFGGVVIWRCFVYNCRQDWRDRVTDRANAAYDHFMPLDGQFLDNVILQIKNGPMDFQVREPVSPLIGGLQKTNHILEFQIAQEYTGQQKHVCYLVPQWKEVLNFDTRCKGEGSTVKKLVSGEVYPQAHSGFAAVSNTGDDMNWTGHTLAQANLYGYGRLAWNPDFSSEAIAEEWIRQTFSDDPQVLETVRNILMRSWPVYEQYTSPLGIGWMINPNHHYGPSVDGYEYSAWGTYHRADCFGIGVDRTQKGTANTRRYHEPVARMYEDLETCPEELLLYFHHIPYTYRLKSGKTLIQHIYDTHFEGVEEAEGFKAQWLGLKDLVDAERFDQVLQRLETQIKDAKEWRDVVNSYFYRKTGIADEKGRTIY